MHFSWAWRILEYSPAHLDTSSLYGKFPWNSSRKVCEDAGVSSHEVQGCSLTHCPAFCLWDAELHDLMVTVAKAALTSPTRCSLLVLQDPAAHLSSLTVSVAESYCQCFPGISWTMCSWLCWPSSTYQGGSPWEPKLRALPGSIPTWAAWVVSITLPLSFLL